MGMFDSFYDLDGVEWQTKAYGRALARYEIGERVPDEYGTDYQVKVLGGKDPDPYQRSLVTIHYGLVKEIDAEREPDLPLVDYSGGFLDMGQEAK